MTAVLVALLLAQEPDPFGGDEPSTPTDATPLPPKKGEDAPLVIPPPDGPVPDGVPKGEDAPPWKPPVARPKDQHRALLQIERQQLLDGRPSYLVPTMVTTLGGLGLVIGAALALIGLSAALQDDVKVSFVGGTVLGFAGLGGLVFGLIWEREVSLDREPFNARIEEIEQELGWWGEH